MEEGSSPVSAFTERRDMDIYEVAVSMYLFYCSVLIICSYIICYFYCICIQHLVVLM